MAKSNLQLKDSSRNHELSFDIDAVNKTVTAGAVYNYADNSLVGLEVSKGRLGGSVVHSGESHSLKLNFNKDGKYYGTYRDDDLGGLELEIEGGVARVSKGVFPPTGMIRLKGADHEIRLDLDGKGRISGRIKSRLSKSALFRLDLAKGSISGEITHKGPRHETRMTLSSGGWKGLITIRKGKSSITLDVKGGRDFKLSEAWIKSVVAF